MLVGVQSSAYKRLESSRVHLSISHNCKSQLLYSRKFQWFKYNTDIERLCWSQSILSSLDWSISFFINIFSKVFLVYAIRAHVKQKKVSFEKVSSNPTQANNYSCIILFKKMPIIEFLGRVQV
jgi:hypothetical protein